MSNQKEQDAAELKSLRQLTEDIDEAWKKGFVDVNDNMVIPEDAAITITTLLAGA